MIPRNISIQTSVLAVLRGHLSASCVADRYGVTEAQVYEWQDTFLVAGVLALDQMLGGHRPHNVNPVSDPTTTTMGPTTPPTTFPTLPPTTPPTTPPTRFPKTTFRSRRRAR